MPDITYNTGDIVLVDEKSIAIKMPDGKFLFPPVEKNSGNLPFIRNNIPEEKLFPISRLSVNQLNDSDKRIIATTLCTMEIDFSWIKVGPVGIRPTRSNS